MREQHRVGIRYLDEVTTLLQRVRTAHPTAGVFEASDFQWWWRKPRSTDVIPQLFWFDDSGKAAAAVIATDWGASISLDPIVMPDAAPGWVAHVVERGLAHANEAGLVGVDFAIVAADIVMTEILAGHGFTKMEEEGVDSWLAADARPPISPLHSDYRLASRLETFSEPHHMRGRNGLDVESRLRDTSLYRADLDLVVLGRDKTVAAYGLFWFDPVTATGLVEPMRTEDAHQRRGIGRHVLTAGINLLFEAGADRIKIAWEKGNPASSSLYRSVGFKFARECTVVSRAS